MHAGVPVSVAPDAACTVVNVLQVAVGCECATITFGVALESAWLCRGCHGGQMCAIDCFAWRKPAQSAVLPQIMPANRRPGNKSSLSVCQWTVSASAYVSQLPCALRCDAPLVGSFPYHQHLANVSSVLCVPEHAHRTVSALAIGAVSVKTSHADMHCQCTKLGQFQI